MTTSLTSYTAPLFFFTCLPFSILFYFHFSNKFIDFLGYCEALRSELTSSGVNVSCVSPGYIKTNLSKGAIRGDGSKHGQMDETTAKGADPDNVAVEVLDSAVVGGKTDFVVAATFSAKAALILKFFAPSILEKQLVKRFMKASSSSTK